SRLNSGRRASPCCQKSPFLLLCRWQLSFSSSGGSPTTVITTPLKRPPDPPWWTRSPKQNKSMKSAFSQTRAHDGSSIAQGVCDSPGGNRLLDAAGSDGDVRNDRGSASRIILVPLKLSGSSHLALNLARSLARKIKARLVLLHVVQLNIAGEERGIPRTRLVNELCRE